MTTPEISLPVAPPGLLRRARAALPQGNSLPDADWARRHGFLLALLWIHALVIPLYGMAEGYGVLHCLLEGGVVGVIAALGTWWAPDRKRASVLVAFGLLTSSALLVHLSRG